MAFRRETRIRTFIQMELEACRDELSWLIRCHNCAAYNCPKEECPPRPLPIPPDHMDNLQSRLGKVMKGILPPTKETWTARGSRVRAALSSGHTGKQKFAFI